MSPELSRQIASLPKLKFADLTRLYAEVFGEASNCRNKAWLVKRIAWRLQMREEGGLSERARRLAMEIADDADLRRNPPKTLPAAISTTAANPETQVEVPFPTTKDDRLPPPGTVLIRQYKGQDLQVLVRSDGFEYGGEVFGSLSAVARKITGSHCNGYLFFRLQRGESS